MALSCFFAFFAGQLKNLVFFGKIGILDGDGCCKIGKIEES
jgi:hypothetical protein